MARRAAAPLQRRAAHRVADVLADIERWAEGLCLLRRRPFVVDAVQPVGMDVALGRIWMSVTVWASIITPRGGT